MLKHIYKGHHDDERLLWVDGGMLVTANIGVC
jgi:hypothetical protein